MSRSHQTRFRKATKDWQRTVHRHPNKRHEQQPYNFHRDVAIELQKVYSTVYGQSSEFIQISRTVLAVAADLRAASRISVTTRLFLTDDSPDG
jgi:hypothetical protein